MNIGTWTLTPLQCRAGARRVFPQTRQVVLPAPSAKRREVFGESHEGRAASFEEPYVRQTSLRMDDTSSKAMVCLPAWSLPETENDTYYTTERSEVIYRNIVRNHMTNQVCQGTPSYTRYAIMHNACQQLRVRPPYSGRSFTEIFLNRKNRKKGTSISSAKNKKYKLIWLFTFQNITLLCHLFEKMVDARRLHTTLYLVYDRVVSKLKEPRE